MASIANPSVPISWGELLDKISILEIKHERIADLGARANVLREHGALNEVAGGVLRDPAITRLFRSLKSVNETLWEVEDAIREEEARGSFGSRFVRLARAVYRRNDERAAIKREINLALESELIEEKSYWTATSAPAKVMSVAG